MSKEKGLSRHLAETRETRAPIRRKTGREWFTEWSGLLKGKSADTDPFDITHVATEEPHLRWHLSLQKATNEQPEAIIATCTESEQLAGGVAVDRHMTRFTVDDNDELVVDLRKETQDRPTGTDKELPQGWTDTEYEAVTGQERVEIINYLGGVIRHAIELDQQ